MKKITSMWSTLRRLLGIHLASLGPFALACNFVFLPCPRGSVTVPLLDLLL